MSARSILITGGTGLVGSRLKEILEGEGYAVSILTRKSSNPEQGLYHWDPDRGELDGAALENARAVVHLAGANIGEARWSPKRKKEIVESRTKSSQLLYERFSSMSHPPDVVISASAIGIYGDRGDEWLNEQSKRGDGFLADVTEAWEQKTSAIENVVARSVLLRFGVVLSNQGGALEKMKTPIQMLVGSPLGSGGQYVSWIHVDDLCRMILQSLADPSIKGIYNAVAPEPVTNKEMTIAIAKELKKPLLFPPVPSFALKLLLGEMSDLVLQSQRVSSEKIQKAGYRYHFPDLESALADLL